MGLDFLCGVYEINIVLISFSLDKYSPFYPLVAYTACSEISSRFTARHSPSHTPQKHSYQHHVINPPWVYIASLRKFLIEKPPLQRVDIKPFTEGYFL